MNAASFVIPTIDYAKIAPIIIVLGMAVVGVLVEAFVPRKARRPIQLVLTFATLIVAFLSVVGLAGTRALIAGNSIAIDGPALYLQGLILLVAIFGAMLLAERRIDPAGDAFAPRASALPGSEDELQFTKRGFFQTEIWPLFLFSVGGMLIFPAANDLLLVFVALEVMSLPLYLLAGMARRRRLLSQEAALKYFVLGAFASAFFLYGSALLYGYAGSISFPEIANAMASKPGESTLLIAGTALVIVGLLFKIAAVPFHQWTPDVYQGAPTPLTGFMAAGVKVAAFGALLRMLYVALGGARWDWTPLLWVIAILTMFVGSIIAVSQSNIKRMLAYSAIAQAGFILIGVIAASPAGLASALFYLTAYSFITIGAFAIVTMVRNASGEANDLDQWKGLGKKSPWIGAIFAIFMLALAGIPLTTGFVAKFAVFSAGIASGAAVLVIFGVVASVISAFFYARVIVLMFFSDVTETTADVVLPSPFTTIALAVSAALTVILGVIPQPLLDLVAKADIFIR